jgi:D-sedoheptulose 7-phosphate isomerase
MEASFASGGKLLVCGNGGSAADADHIVGELMKGFYKKRSLPAEEASKLGEYARYLQGALPAIALTQHAALSTAFLNDVNPEMGFAQQVYGYGRDGDVLLGISTSGNSKNVCNAVRVAMNLGIKTIGLTGRKGGRLSEISDVCIGVPADITADIQELHLPIYHTLCAMLEELFFD